MKSPNPTFHFSLFTIPISLLIVLLSYSPPVSSQQEWELIHNTDTDIGIEYVFMYDENHIWGAFEDDIYFSDDGGYSWEQQFSLEGNYLVDIYFADSLKGWFVGWDRAYGTTNGGDDWELQLHNYNGINYHSVFFINPDTGWIVGSHRVIYCTHNGGEHWFIQNPINYWGPYALYDVEFIDSMHGCAVGGAYANNDQLIMTTSNGGDDWTEILTGTEEAMIKVQYVSPGQVWSCDSDCGIYYSNDSGYTWQKKTSIDSYCGYCMRDLHFFNEQDAMVITDCRSYNCLTFDAWNSWEEQWIYGNNVVERVSFADELTGIAVGYWGNIIKTNNAGLSWKRLNEKFNQIGFFSPINGWVTQAWMNKNFMHTTDGGFTWSEFETIHTGNLNAMDILSDHIGYVVTDHGELMKTINAGASWDMIGSNLDSAGYSSMQFLDENTGFLCGSKRFLKTINGGQDWVVHSFDTVEHIQGLEFINEDEGWIVGIPGFVAHTKDGGMTWSAISLPSYNFVSVDFIDENNGFILSFNNEEYRTTDGGLTWESMNLDIVFPYEVCFTDPLHGWICGQSQVFFTSNGGADWSEIFNVEANYYDNMIMDFFALDTANAWICTADGRIFTCSDIVGMEEKITTSVISIYPNPVTNVISITLNIPTANTIVFSLFSLEGKFILQNELEVSAKGNTLLDISYLPSGIYFLNIRGATASESFKVVKY